MPKEIVKKLGEPSSITTNTPSLRRDDWLENFAVGIRDNTYVMSEFLPEMAVQKDSAKYRVYSPMSYFKAAPKRAETALPEQSALKYDEDIYYAEEYALEGWVSDDAVRNSPNGLDPFTDETDYLTRKIFLTEEILIVNEIQSAVKAAGTGYYRSLTALTCWNGADANILGDLSQAIITVTNNIGKRPNLLSMNTDTYETVCADGTVQQILAFNSPSVVTAAMPIPSLRGLRIVLADATVNAGTYETPSYSNILYDVDAVTPLRQTVIAAYVSPNDKLTLGRNFVPKAFKVLKGRGLEGDRRQASLVAVWKKLAPKVTNVNAGYVIGNVLGV
jgi:hypothetical protein